jgi:hypothetical protein
MKNVHNLPYLPSSNYSMVQQRTRKSNCTNSALIKGSTTRSTGTTAMKVSRGAIIDQGTRPRTSRPIIGSATRIQMVDKPYDTEVSAIHGEIFAIHGEFAAIQDEVPAERKKTVRMKTMEINAAH